MLTAKEKAEVTARVKKALKTAEEFRNLLHEAIEAEDLSTLAVLASEDTWQSMMYEASDRLCTFILNNRNRADEWEQFAIATFPDFFAN